MGGKGGALRAVNPETFMLFGFTPTGPTSRMGWLVRMGPAANDCARP